MLFVFSIVDGSKIEAFEERFFFGFPELSLDFLSSSYWVEFSKCRRVPSTYNPPIPYIHTSFILMPLARQSLNLKQELKHDLKRQTKK